MIIPHLLRRPVLYHFSRLMCSTAPKRLTYCTIIASLSLLSGCQHRSTLDASIDAIHSIMGGEIARLHPPTPGYTQRAPDITQIPTTVPDFPSQEAQNLITTRLEQDRNFAQRYSAAGGALPIGMVNPPPPRTSNEGSMTLTSQAQNAGPDRTEPTAAPIITPSTPQAQTTSLIYQPISHALPIYLPDPGTPPTPLLFPGFNLPENIASLVPDFDTAQPTGTLIRFQTDTDHLVDNQSNAFNKIISERHHHRLVISGYGTTLTAQAGLNPDEQEREIALGLLRARVVAHQLQQLGVPETDMRLIGLPIGDGVRVAYEMNNSPSYHAQAHH